MTIDDDAPDGPSFGGLRYSSTHGLLLDADGRMVPLRRQSLEVFRYLAARADRLVTREALMAAVWGRLQVTDDSLTQCVCEIRRALGDDGRRTLRTLPRRGYLLVTDVPTRVRRDDAEPPRPVEREPVRAARALPVPARRSPPRHYRCRRARPAALASTRR